MCLGIFLNVFKVSQQQVYRYYIAFMKVLWRRFDTEVSVVPHALRAKKYCL